MATTWNLSFLHTIPHMHHLLFRFITLINIWFILMSTYRLSMGITSHLRN